MRKNWMMRNEKQKGILFLLLFSFAFFAIYVLTYELFSWYGKSYIWYYDGLKQHFASLVYLGRYYRELAVSFLHGDFTLPMYDFTIGMGEDVITTLNFYGLGDPLTLLAAFVPDEKMETLYDFLVIFRIYLAGLSFAWMCRQRGKCYGSTFVGALIYAFSGYALHVAVKHPFFVIPMIFLPLSVVGVERALEKKKLTLLIVLVFLTALNGFYFFYMNTIFLGIYAVIHMVCKKWRIGDIRKGIGRCAAAYGIGTAMAAVIFLPTIVAFLSGTRSKSTVNPGNLLFFDADRYVSIVAQMIGTPRITWDYLGLVSLVFPALVVLFTRRFREKIELKVNIIIWTALMLVPFGGYLLNGCSYVSGRFLYLTTFVYVLGAVEVLPELFRLNRKRMCICTGAALAYGALVTLSDGRNVLYSWWGFIMLVVTLAVLFFGSIRHVKQSLMFLVLTVVVALNIIENGWGLFGAQGYLSEFEDKGTALATLQNSPEAEVASIGGQNDSSHTASSEYGGSRDVSQDVGFFRVDASEKSTQNAAMVNGNYGVSSYFSMSNPNRIEYLQEVENGGVLDSMFKISGLDGRTSLLALASVKYYAVPAETAAGGVPYGYKKVKAYERNGKKYDLYENEYFLPLGITFNTYMNAADIRELDGLVKQDLMLKTVVLDEDVSGMTKLTDPPSAELAAFLSMKSEKSTTMELAESMSERLQEVPFTVLESENVDASGDNIKVKKGGASMTIEWQGEKAGEYYVRLGKYNITQKNRTFCDITMSCGETEKTIRALKDTWNWYFGREKYLLNMGMIDDGKRNTEESDAGDMGGKRTCRIRFECRGTFKKSDLKVYAQPMVDYGEMVSQRCEDVMEHVAVGTNRVSGEISLKKDKFLFLSIPYSDGWRAKVDGKETEIFRADTAYMALKMEPGRHQLELEYTTPYLKAGGVITLFGCLAFAVYEWINRRRGRRGV